MFTGHTKTTGQARPTRYDRARRFAGTPEEFAVEFLILVALIAAIAFIASTRSAVTDLAFGLRLLNAKLDAVSDLLANMARAPREAPAQAPAGRAGLVDTPEPEPPGPVVPVEPVPEPWAHLPPAPGMQPDEPAVPPIEMAEPLPQPEAAAGQAEDAPSATPAAPPQDAAGSLTDIEKRFGTQWVVWVGGLALALGGIFLMRYSIEQGYFGPGMRVALGAVLALALVAGGEGTRRQEIRLGISGAATAHIPSILTAAGTTIAYATVYGAYALYAFLSPAAAFVLLGIVALGTLAAALVHGPALAGLGLVGAYVTPMLVSTSHPSYWALYVYLVVVTAAALSLARMRLWRWLAITATLFGIVWMLAGIGDPHVEAISAHAFYAIAGFALAAMFVVAGLFYGPPAERGGIDPVSSGALGGFLLGAFLLVLASDHQTIALATLVVLIAAAIAIALRTEAAVGAMLAGAAFAALVVIDWALDAHFIYLELPTRFGGGRTLGAQFQPIAMHLGFGAACAALIGGASVAAQGRSEQPLVPLLWASAGVLTPITILIALYYGIYEFGRSIPFAGIALLIAALYAAASETLVKRPPRPGLAAATAVIATGAIASLALALTFALEKGWLTVGLALMAPGIAYVAEKRPLPALRVVVAAVVVLVLVRMAWEPRVVGDDVGTTPIFNWLLYGYGVPAVAFGIAGHILRRRADDLAARMTNSIAILFAVLLAFLEIRHLVYGGDVYHRGTGLAELAMQVSVGLTMTIGLERVRVRTGSIVHDAAARVIGGLSFAAIVFGLALRENPMLTGDPVGGPLFNLVLLGYGLPAMLMAVLARMMRTTRPQPVYVVAAVTAIALALAYFSLEVRTLFHGTVLTRGFTTDAEQYTYSAVWLAFGVALLLAGIALQSQPARLASAAVVTLTAAKVFLYDLAGVQGVYRAFSFIGLGLVLIGIGLLYQRLLFPARAATAE